ncbi:MAG: homoserine dehydrogenase [Proteobacteria bacterium]|nr:homoserine dehydrogenase [Pseudomonadota bacterium]
MKTVRIGLLGCGVVGTAFCRVVEKKRELFKKRDEIDLEITAVGVANSDKEREQSVPTDRIVKGWQAVTSSPNVDVVVELIGGARVAHEAILDSLNRGRNVVTANKMLLASHGEALTKLAAENKCCLQFEAAVGCGVPVIGAVGETLSANSFESVLGIVNGTTNFILSRMSDEGLSYERALSLAKERGFAESDPTFDVEGKDAAQKLSILAALAFGVEVPDREIYTEGISQITDLDMKLAAGFGYIIKLLAIGNRTSQGLELRVHPALVSSSHPLAAVRDEYNAFFVKGDISGEVMIYGKGAGPIPTAGAVLADVAHLAQHGTTTKSGGSWAYNNLEHVPIGDIETSYYMVFPVVDTPGVIGRITSILGSYGINIASTHAHLPEKRTDAGGILQVISQHARERDVRSAFNEIGNLPILKGKARFYRIEVPN